MKRLFLILILASLVCHGWTQETNNHQYSSAPENSRFQIVQSEQGARFTFNIDKYTGSVFLLVQGKSGVTWQLIDSEEQLYDETIPNQVNYQLFTSALGIRYTFLININTGITWQLVEDKKTNVYWWSALE